MASSWTGFPGPGAAAEHPPVIANLNILSRRIASGGVMFLPSPRLFACILLCSALAGPAFASRFTHPGVLVSRPQLEFVRQQVEAGAEPWAGAFKVMTESRHASLTHEPKPRAIVECGPYSNPDVGCRAERLDAAVAYTHALLWSLTGKKVHAEKAIEVMNAWSAVVQSHAGHNAPLQSAWTASIFPRAAEIIRHTYDGWRAPDIERFSAMLRRAYLPHIEEGRPHFNGNWELSMIEAMIGCAVFLDDEPLFTKGVAMWRKRVPAYVYLKSDGALPVPPPNGGKETREALIKYWYGQETFVDGLGQETCRDLPHLQMGFAAMHDAAETARLQGVDLYGSEAKRITAAMEFHAGFLLGDPVPGWLGGGKLDARTIQTWEIGYNHFHGRLGLELPRTRELILKKIRPSKADNFMLWETLTHAETANSVPVPVPAATAPQR